MCGLYADWHAQAVLRGEPLSIAKSAMLSETMKTPLVVVLCFMTALPACTKHKPFVADVINSQPIMNDEVRQASYQQIEPMESLTSSLPPFDLDSDGATINYWDMSLQEATQFALANSTVMRDIGAHLLQSPDTMPTIYNPSIWATDPRTGEEAALSAFDAQLATRLFYERNERWLNNELLGGGTNFFEQDLGRFQTELAKTAASGTALRRAS